MFQLMSTDYNKMFVASQQIRFLKLFHTVHVEHKKQEPNMSRFLFKKNRLGKYSINI